MSSTARQLGGRAGALQSWANTPDRTARTAPATRRNPSNVNYWLERLDPVRFAEATEHQKLQAAESARKAHFARLALASVKARAKKKNPAQH